MSEIEKKKTKLKKKRKNINTIIINRVLRVGEKFLMKKKISRHC
jgi:hypothetical protein